MEVKTVKTEGEGGHLQDKEKSTRRNLSTIRSQPSSFHNCEKTNFCCLNHLVYGICCVSLNKLIQYFFTLTSSIQSVRKFYQLLLQNIHQYLITYHLYCYYLGPSWHLKSGLISAARWGAISQLILLFPKT